MEGKPATQVMESDLLNGILPQPVLPVIVFLCQSVGKVLKCFQVLHNNIFVSQIVLARFV